MRNFLVPLFFSILFFQVSAFAQSGHKWCVGRGSCSNPCFAENGVPLEFGSKDDAFNYAASQTTFTGWGGEAGPFSGTCYQKNYNCTPDGGVTCGWGWGGAFAHDMGCADGRSMNAAGDCVCGGGQTDDRATGACAPRCPNGSAPSNGVCGVNNQAVGPSCPVAGNPIGISAGNKFQTEVDADFGTLKIQRTYNSGFPDDLASGTGENYRLGRKWTDFYDRTIKSTVEGADARRPSGKIISFKNLSGVLTPNPEFRDSLVKFTDAGGAVSGWEYRAFEDDSLERYNAQGKLVSITDRKGRQITLSYITDPKSARLEQVTDDLGNTLTFTWGQPFSDWVVTAITHSSGQVFEYTHTIDRNLTQVKFPSGKTRIYHYTGPGILGPQVHLLGGITNEDGIRYVTWGYDSQGYPISSEGIGGANKITVSYSPGMFKSDEQLNASPEALTATVTENGVTKTYNFTRSFGINRSVGVDQGTTSLCNGTAGAGFTYDSNGFVTSSTDVNGKRTTYTRDSKGRELSRTEAVGTSLEKTITTEYHSQFNLVTKITEPHQITSYSYDNRGNLLERRIESADGLAAKVWSYTYNADGYLVSESGPSSIDDNFTYAYNDKRQLISKTNALGLVTQYFYDSSGRKYKEINGTGVETEKTFDSLGRIATVKSGASLATYQYDAVGNITKVSYSDGTFEAFSFDSENRLASYTGVDGVKKSYTFDSLGRMARKDLRDASNTLVASEIVNYSATVITSTQGSFVQANYLNERCQVRGVSDASGAKSITYNVFGNILQESVGGVATNFDYDANGRMKQVQDPRNLKTIFTYNSFGDVTSVQSPDSGSKTFEYQSGKLSKSVDARGVASVNRYDAYGRLMQVEISRPTVLNSSGGTVQETLGATVNYSYENASGGKTSTVQNGYSKLSYEYDAEGKLVSKTQVVKGKSLKVSYDYDQFGRVSRITYPSGKVVDLQYTAGKITQIALNGTPILNGISYSPFGPAQSWTWGGGFPNSRTINQFGKVTSFPLAGEVATLSYDGAKRPTELVNPLKAATEIFSYDSLNRLSAVTVGSNSSSYGYDDGGNRIFDIFSISPKSNQLMSSAKKVEYDAAGNLVKKGNLRLHYGLDGRLSSVMQMRKDDSGIKVRMGSYLYNGLGERIYKSALTETGGERQYYIYDENAHVIGEYSAASSKEYVYLQDMPVIFISNSDVYYVETDHLGTPRSLRNWYGNVVWKWDSDAYGAGLPDEDVDKDGKKVTMNLRFPGQIYDKESGLHYNYFRDYDPALGRYIESDPIGIKGGLNTYAYVEGKPHALTDPLGLAPSSNGGGGGNSNPQATMCMIKNAFKICQDRYSQMFPDQMITSAAVSSCALGYIQGNRDQRGWGDVDARDADHYLTAYIWSCNGPTNLGARQGSIAGAAGRAVAGAVVAGLTTVYTPIKFLFPNESPPTWSEMKWGYSGTAAGMGCANIPAPEPCECDQYPFANQATTNRSF